MTDQSMRAEFEAWAAKQTYEIKAKKPDGRYWSSHTHIVWEAWQAATRQALERAAKVCVKGDADDCADAIRALEG